MKLLLLVVVTADVGQSIREKGQRNEVKWVKRKNQKLAWSSWISIATGIIRDKSGEIHDNQEDIAYTSWLVQILKINRNKINKNNYIKLAPKEIQI